MQLEDINGIYEVHSVEELESGLQRRYREKNAFWLRHDSQPVPTLSVLVHGEIAYLHFIANESDPGCASVDQLGSYRNETLTQFSISEFPGDDIFVENDTLVSFADAVAACKEFYRSSERPASIEWRQL